MSAQVKMGEGGVSYLFFIFCNYLVEIFSHMNVIFMEYECIQMWIQKSWYPRSF